jgi:hypothetical protein
MKEKDVAFVHNERKAVARPEAPTRDHDIEIAADRTTDSSIIQEGEVEKEEERTPSAEDQLEALGIPNWRELEKKLVRRLDMTLLPCLWVLYLFSELSALLGGAHLTVRLPRPVQYRAGSYLYNGDRHWPHWSRVLDRRLHLVLWVSPECCGARSRLTLSYIIGQIPSNMIMTRIRPHIYLPAMAIVWSGVSAATCGVKNAQGLWAVRFMLGVVEAPLFPGALMMVGCCKCSPS